VGDAPRIPLGGLGGFPYLLVRWGRDALREPRQMHHSLSDIPPPHVKVSKLFTAVSPSQLWSTPTSVAEDSADYKDTVKYSCEFRRQRPWLGDHDDAECLP